MSIEYQKLVFEILKKVMEAEMPQVRKIQELHIIVSIVDKLRQLDECKAI